MSTIRVTHSIGDLAADLRRIPVKAATAFPRVVIRNAKAGNKIAQGLAREKAGIHGTNYYKRLTAEVTGRLSAEYGPEGVPKSDFLGVGFRHGVNLDLPNSADIIGPKFADDAGGTAAGLFW